MRLHDLRHNIATLLVVKMKNPLKLAQDLLGHSGDAITNQVYTHSDPASLRKMTGLDNVPEHAARFTFAMARHAAVDLAQVFGTTPETLTTSRLSAEDFALLRRNLAEFGLHFRDGEAAETKLASLRSMYEPYVDALANHLLMPLPEWMPRNQVLDDWQTSIWDHFSLTSQRPLNKVR